MRLLLHARRCGAALLLTLATAAAQAAIVTYQFGGVVTSSVVAGVSSGSRIVGFYTFDDAVADSFENTPASPIDPIAAAAVGHYAQSGAAGFRIGGFSLLTSFDPTRPGLYIGNDQFGLDSYSVSTLDFALSLQDTTATALSSDDIPALVPQVSSFTNTQFYFGPGDIIGVIDTLVEGSPNVAQVPLPGSLSLAALGLAVLALPRRRQLLHRALPGARRRRVPAGSRRCTFPGVAASCDHNPPPPCQRGRQAPWLKPPASPQAPRPRARGAAARPAPPR